MELKRSILREKIMTCLYQIELYSKNNIPYNIDAIINEVIEIENNFAKDIIYGVVDNKEAIDNIINGYLIDWDLNRLGMTDQSILRSCVYELLYTDTPDLVCINEAIELTKKYSDDKVVKLVNGVLDKVYHNKGI